MTGPVFDAFTIWALASLGALLAAAAIWLERGNTRDRKHRK